MYKHLYVLSLVQFFLREDLNIFVSNQTGNPLSKIH